MGKFEVHFSRSLENKKGTTNPVLLDMMADIWAYDTFEAATKEEVTEKLFEKYGKERINYVLSVTPIEEQKKNE